jgi:hypothetical protein
LNTESDVISFQDGQKYYLQKEGIPQGSVLSSLLCSLYYGYIELNYLADLPLALNKDDNESTKVFLSSLFSLL